MSFKCMGLFQYDSEEVKIWERKSGIKGINIQGDTRYMA